MTGPATTAGRDTRRRGPELRLLPAAGVVWAAAITGSHTGVRGAAAVIAAVLATAGIIGLLVPDRGLRRALLRHGALLLVLTVPLLPSVQTTTATRVTLEGAGARGAILTGQVRLLGEPRTATPPAWATEDAAAPAGRLATARLEGGPVRIGSREVMLPRGTRVILRDTDGMPLGAARAGDVLEVRGSLRIDGTYRELRISSARTVQRETGPRAVLRAHALRSTAHLPPDVAALVRGMSIGDTRGLSQDTEEAMRRSGISHLVAVSGANIALILGAVVGPLLLLGVPRRTRLAVGALAVTGYVVLVGPEPSVLRAATMAAPLLLARALGHRAHATACLALTVLIWALHDPGTAAGIGFVLSALATASILLLVPPAARLLRDLTGSHLPGSVAATVAVPLVAQMVCTPVLVLLAPEMSAWSVLVNLLVAPLVLPATLGGVAAVLLGPWWPAAARCCATVAGGAAEMIVRIARAAAELPGARIPLPDGPRGALLATGVLLALAVAAALRHRRPVRWLLAAVLVAQLTVPVLQRTPWGPTPDWQVALCDVGQGDALLIRPAPTTTVLIDTGPDPENLRRCLDHLRVENIDLLVLTHPHADHTGGIPALTGGRIPAAQWVCPLPEARSAVVPGVPVRAVQRGDATRLGQATVEVLWPPDASQARAASAAETGGGEDDDANDCSVVLDVRLHGGPRIVALGDLEPVAQRRLAELQPGPAAVVKVAHHGSRRQDAGLYRQLSPRLALIGVGRDNSFGHPTAHTLDLLRSSGAGVVRTDEHGTVVLPRGDLLAPRSVTAPR
ncbi:ComEC/Rec2 family competence protein [Brachybacterium sp. EF45031]|uniref:ComEC/Rec2 family competence protein n=1 Tax=Brachybacterium sillae TaxID=2810536 RepID=UPI00217EB191|nr:ComEC/Rec2 family competence protein [Brachybacterium sillae]MCS6710783.1 ComEC/Rec2 family competence protein [Brachybacterium sillae]